MISLQEARAILLGDLEPVDAETVSLSEVHGRTLAAPVIALRTQPSFRASAMDGYAVRSSDLGEVPARLKLLGASAAGHAFSGSVEPGTVAGVSTGAPMPDGAEQVVMREDAVVDGDHVTLDAEPSPDKHVREAGVDFQEGDRLVEAGQVLDAIALSLAASTGAMRPVVRRRPVVAILSTGDELVEPGEPLGPSQIVNSNATALVAMVRELGGEPNYLGIVGDDREAVRAGLHAGNDADLIITIGGASVGDHDHLRSVFSEEGGALAFEKIAVKPGKPTWFGWLKDTPVLGLPGNPVSALVVAKLLLAPAMAQLLGQEPSPDFAFETARLGEPLSSNGPRETFIRGVFRSDADGMRHVHILANQDSSALSALVKSDCLIRRMGNAKTANAGNKVEILRL